MDGDGSARFWFGVLLYVTQHCHDPRNYILAFNITSQIAFWILTCS